MHILRTRLPQRVRGVFLLEAASSKAPINNCVRAARLRTGESMALGIPRHREANAASASFLPF